MNKIAISMFLLGLLFGWGPCIASCGPLLISYIAGTKKGIIKSLAVYILFSLARVAVYIIFSLSIFFLGKFTLEKLLGNFSRFILIFGAGFIILVGILITLGKNLQFWPWQFLRRNILECDKKSIVILGLVIGLLPCAPLLAMLSYVGLVSKSWANSLFYSISFGLGTVLSPLILLTILSGFIGRRLQNKKYYRFFSFICGLIIIFLGIQLISRVF